ncbi:MAG: hypothetical protein EHM79_06365 [Geobacter sp.]|nr:MAG: hypothetical protein EHM79_06365 [Geobacter sp.]
MEFFQCPCPQRGEVKLDGKDQGPNKDDAGNLLVKQCNRGLHFVSLQCSDGKECVSRLVQITDTDPISPLEVPFQCET